MFELLALRELVNNEELRNRFLPVVEPVKSNYSSLRLFVEGMKDKGQHFALVLNPLCGDRAGEAELLSKLCEEIPALKDPECLWTPAYICDAGHLNERAEQIKQDRRTLDRDQLGHMLILWDEIDAELLAASRLLEGAKYVLTKVPNSRALNRYLKSNQGQASYKLIRLDSNFKEQRKNADYLGKDDEQYTEEPWYYADDGFDGIGDFTTLPDSYIEGGMLPYALAIHFVYHKREKNEVRIHHFVSNTNDDNTNIQGKFGEAAKKVKEFWEKQPEEFDPQETAALRVFISKAESADYPGLGYLKKLSIGHCIETMVKVLSQISSHS